MPLPNIKTLVKSRASHALPVKAKTRHSRHSPSPSSTFKAFSKTTTQIPQKFHAVLTTLPHDDFATFIRATSTAADSRETIYGSEVPSSFINQPTAAPTQGRTATVFPASGASPSVPKWAVHFMAGALSFLVVVAAVLYCVQFPPRFTWLQKFMRWKRSGYTQIDQDEKERQRASFTRSSTGATSQGGADGCEDDRSDCLRRRRPQHLSINTTSSHYRGLAIAKVDDKDGEQSLEKRPSYDSEALRAHPKSPATAAWQSFTAPLPSAHYFGAGLKNSKSHSTPASQSPGTGVYYTPSVAVSTPDLFDNRSLYHDYNTPEAAADDEKPLGSAVFQKINDGIYKAADRLSRTFHDQVNGPEDGLLLPVYNHEREQPLSPSVFAV